jgi:Zn-dependent protease with chaperone function
VLIAFLLLGLFTPLFGPETQLTAFFPKVPVLWGMFFAFFLSLLWLYFQSWLMLVRAWERREVSENVKLLLILVFFCPAAGYYFYWKRYDIDASVP